jgi:ubiquitin C-terminal hydrolase
MEQLKKYCMSSSLIDLAEIDNQTTAFMLSQVPKVLALYPDINNVYHKRALQILEIFSEPPPIGDQTYCKKLYGLKNTLSSCYLDSVLFSLFAIPNRFVDESIIYSDLKLDAGTSGSFYCAPRVEDPSDITELNNSREIDLYNRNAVQQSLREIAESIRGTKSVDYCTNLRAVLEPCSSVDNFSEGGMKDPAEFLIFILRLFDTDKAVRKQTVYSTKFDINVYQTDLNESNPILKVERTSFMENESIIQYVDKSYLNNLNRKSIYYISKFLTTIDAVLNQKDTNIIYTKNLYSSPYVIFYCERISFSERAYNKMIESGIVNLENLPVSLNKVRIIPSRTITIGDGSRFQLSSIVVWKGYHYTSYFKCGLEWYYYDDMDSNIRKVGSYQRLLRSNPSPVTNGILYFYISL